MPRTRKSQANLDCQMSPMLKSKLIQQSLRKVTTRSLPLRTHTKCNSSCFFSSSNFLLNKACCRTSKLSNYMEIYLADRLPSTTMTQTTTVTIKMDKKSGYLPLTMTMDLFIMILTILTTKSSSNSYSNSSNKDSNKNSNLLDSNQVEDSNTTQAKFREQEALKDLTSKPQSALLHHLARSKLWV